jgi:hypothetical protein
VALVRTGVSEERGTYRLHPQGEKNHQAGNNVSSN